jgi:hypothetical protein
MGSSSSDLKGSEPRNARRQAVSAVQIVKCRADKELVERGGFSSCSPVSFFSHINNLQQYFQLKLE